MKTTAVLSALLALGLVGCATSDPAAPPLGSGAVAPNLRGTWTGTWDGRPLTLVLSDQLDVTGSRSGIYVGPWQVFGHPEPGVSGVLSYTARGDTVSTHVKGWVGYAEPTVTLTLASESSQGQIQLRLRGDPAGRLVGSGTSTLPWVPGGRVELTRQAGGS